MSDQKFSWMTFHRVRFASEQKRGAVQFCGPKRALHWRFGPDSPSGPNGLRTYVSDIWGGAAFYRDQADAEATLEDLPGTLPFLTECVESWHAILCPIAHRGEVNWFGSLDNARNFITAATDPAPGELMVAMTSAGFDPPSPGQEQAFRARAAMFFSAVDAVRDFYGNLPGCLAHGVFSTDVDGITFSAWRSDVDMARAAYRPGEHCTQLGRHKIDSLFDRSSFTRSRVIRSIGAWDCVKIG